LRLSPLASGDGFAEELPPSRKDGLGSRRLAGGNAIEPIDPYEIGRGLV
jgi:hypothetical protein